MNMAFGLIWFFMRDYKNTQDNSSGPEQQAAFLTIKPELRAYMYSFNYVCAFTHRDIRKIERVKCFVLTGVILVRQRWSHPAVSLWLDMSGSDMTAWSKRNPRCFLLHDLKGLWQFTWVQNALKMLSTGYGTDGKTMEGNRVKNPQHLCIRFITWVGFMWITVKI